jgi:hypothetical protein
MWEWLNLNGAGLSSLATAVTAMIAIVALGHTARDSRERSRPMMVAEFQLAVNNDAAIDLVVRNAGPSIARDVTVTFDPRLEVPDDGDRYVTPSLIRRYATAIDAFAPGQEFRNVWWSGRDKGGPDLENHEPTPDEVAVTISYRGFGRHIYRELVRLHINSILMTTRSTSSTSVPGRLAGIHTSLATIAAASEALAKLAAKAERRKADEAAQLTSD